MEEILGTIQDVYIHNFDIVYDLYFTDMRVIAVNIRHPEDAPPKYTLRTALIGNAWDQKKESIKLYELTKSRRSKAKDTTPDGLVVLNPRNFTIPHKQVVKAELKHRLFDWQIVFKNINENNVPWKVLFHIKKKQVPEAERLLLSVKKPGN